MFSKILPCPAGHFCPAGLSDPYLAAYNCPVGFYCPDTSVAPIPCDNGFYCATTKLTEPTGLCAAGYYCMLVTDPNLPTSRCMNGVKCSVGPSTPYGEAPLTAGGLTAKRICPAGYYCQAGSFIPIACPIGTYSSSTGATSLATCQTCAPGQYCVHLG
jgi:hypothetical protein